MSKKSNFFLKIDFYLKVQRKLQTRTVTAFTDVLLCAKMHKTAVKNLTAEIIKKG